jgi:hypothetical protein
MIGMGPDTFIDTVIHEYFPTASVRRVALCRIFSFASAKLSVVPRGKLLDIFYWLNIR